MRPGGYLQQADGTSWMAMYSLNMLTIALELAKENSAYEDIASKFFEHFLHIADAMDGIDKTEIALWDEADGFYNGQEYRVDYEPAESSTGMFGGNSNWRGPIWFPINYLLIESLQKFHHYLGDDFKVECPTGSGQMLTLKEVATDLSQRLTRIFLKDESGRRPFNGETEKFQTDPHWRDLILFNEYFNGDNGAGLGASHQTGWTGLVAKLSHQCGEYGSQDGADLLG